MIKFGCLIIVFFVCFEFLSFARPGKIILKNGRTVSGNIFFQDKKIFVCFRNGSLQLDNREIKSITYDPASREKSHSFLNLLKNNLTLHSVRAPLSTPYDPIIHRAARLHGVDPALVKAVMKAESNFDSKDVSGKGAVGLMQLMPETARKLGIKRDEIFDPEKNILGGTKYLSYMIDLFDGNLSLALAAYNAGPGVVKKYRNIPPYRETQNYIQQVFKYYNHYKEYKSKEKKIFYSYRDKAGKLYITDYPLKSYFLQKVQ